MAKQPVAALRAEIVIQRLSAAVTPLPAVELLASEAIGRVLAEDIAAAFDYPPFDRAVVDGYALRSSDLTIPGERLALSGAIRAGVTPQSAVAPGSCVQINTGAPIPENADAVCMVESTTTIGETLIEFAFPPNFGDGIERRASLRTKDEILVEARQRITPGRLAALIAAGATAIRAYPAPRIAILTTGDELAAPDQTPGDGQIRDSNGPALAELVRQSGGIADLIGRAHDSREALREQLLTGLRVSDMLIVCGGMSKGTHDYVPSELSKLGVEWLVESVDVKPGKPTRIGRTPAGTWIVGLPGNPVSAIVCFHLFARAIMEGLQGLTIRPLKFARCRTQIALSANGNRPMFQPARWSIEPAGDLSMLPIVWRGSGDPFGLADANALLYRPDNSPATAAGDVVPFVPLGLPE